MASTELPALKLPGFNLPIDHRRMVDYYNQPRFSHALRDGCYSEGVTVPEGQMLQLVNQITDKPQWVRKVFDHAIVQKWQDEAIRLWSERREGLSKKMFDFCILELRVKAQRLMLTGYITVLDCEFGIVKSDTAVSIFLKEKLRQCVADLENKPDKEKDWHPGSDEMVLDLLHPSLFPLIYGTSRALSYGSVPLKDCASWIGKGEPVEPRMERSTTESTWESYHWGNFQWLPSDVKFDKDGKPKITSYINNLHPQEHLDLYEVLEQFVAASIPLWNESLSWTDFKNFRINLKGVTFSNEDYFVPEGISYMVSDDEKETISSENPELLDRADVDMDQGLTLEQLQDSGLWYEDRAQHWFENNRVLKPLEPHDFQKWLSRSEQKSPVDLQTEFHDSGLQIIFKLANIHLTPDKPRYSGGSWHIEGALNESICATAIYYLDEDNITDSHLAFRQQLNESDLGMKAAQDEHKSLEAYYGVQNEEVADQILGSVLTREDRLLTFPNTVQHQVRPFNLLDPTRPGHRKILAMFLVDPSQRILSTANVPPQRKDWWIPEVRKVPPFNQLPLEIFEMIVEHVDGFPITWEEALSAREKLMGERGKMMDESNKSWNENTFFFCEH